MSTVDDPDPEMFPDTVAITYRLRDEKDPTGSPLPVYQAGPTAEPCSIQDATVQNVPDLLVVGSMIDTAIWFPGSSTAAAAMKKGDRMVYRRPGDTKDRTCEAVRVVFMGLDDFRLWRADCKRRE